MAEPIFAQTHKIIFEIFFFPLNLYHLLINNPCNRIFLMWRSFLTKPIQNILNQLFHKFVTSCKKQMKSYFWFMRYNCFKNAGISLTMPIFNQNFQINFQLSTFFPKLVSTHNKPSLFNVLFSRYRHFKNLGIQLTTPFFGINFQIKFNRPFSFLNLCLHTCKKSSSLTDSFSRNSWARLFWAHPFLVSIFK